jgi:hypothetical protein
MSRLKLKMDELLLESFDASDGSAAESQGTARAFVPQTQQVKCTYFCTYSACTGLPCVS